MQVVVGLGSSLGDRLGMIRLAVARLARTPGVTLIRRSRAWKNPPAGGVARCSFVNAAVLVSWEGDAPALLAHAEAIEKALGRRAGHARWADRAIDLDLLAADAVVDDPALQVPHPRLVERPFALVPAAEVAPDWIVGGQSLRERAAAFPNGLIPVATL
jgi:2-amino-4-hydroxy-6-hydroxymethyldihydropteridine diphosphokinase